VCLSLSRTHSLVARLNAKVGFAEQFAAELAKEVRKSLVSLSFVRSISQSRVGVFDLMSSHDIAQLSSSLTSMSTTIDQSALCHGAKQGFVVYFVGSFASVRRQYCFVDRLAPVQFESLAAADAVVALRSTLFAPTFERDFARLRSNWI
jgi:hypothetical protein